MDGWVAELRANGVRYCVISDRRFKSMDPVTVYRPGGNKSVYAYASDWRASVRAATKRSAVFLYESVNLEDLAWDTSVRY